MAKQFAQVGDLRIHYELADYTEPWRSHEPESFLLYPGYCRNMEFWRAWVPLLGRDYRVLRLDARGYGETSKPPVGSAITAEMLAKDAIGLMDVLKLERVHWVGESTGGAVGLVAAHAFPDRIASLTVFNTAAKMGAETTTAYALDQPDQAAAIEKYGVAEWCRQTIRWRVDLEHAPEGIGEWIATEMAKTPAHVAVAAFRLFSTVDLTPLLSRIQAPTLLILGSKCTQRRKKNMAEMRDALPHAKLVEIEGYEQGLHFLAPDAMVAEVRRFLQEMAGPRRGWKSGLALM
ncbi:MAG: alpha/beta fold hydrolase [Betaproteobacteria bacterium]|nr:alpha/beta fold hydrolase [Betaproteobacteria bacterium]